MTIRIRVLASHLCRSGTWLRSDATSKTRALCTYLSWTVAEQLKVGGASLAAQTVAKLTAAAGLRLAFDVPATLIWEHPWVDLHGFRPRVLLLSRWMSENLEDQLRHQYQRRWTTMRLRRYQVRLPGPRQLNDNRPLAYNNTNLYQHQRRSNTVTTSTSAHDRAKQLFMDLQQADTEEQVIDQLRTHGYWDNPDAWRNFGDREDNFSTIGNQSSSPDAALVEKVINSVDAVLMGECALAGIQPNSPEAPQSITEAVAQFFRGDRSKARSLGDISNWDNEQRRQVSNRITLAVTGARSNPSITITDNGEGQTPDSMPTTLLSLDKQNKVDINFVQGKFNMGGTGALRFCGHHNLQLVISRRNPQLLQYGSVTDRSNHWGFTIVRREDPTVDKRVSTYRYLAPESGSVLHFYADTLPLFPEGNNAYIRPTQWGTSLKLYEYHLKGKSNILLRDGLLQRLDVLLPRIAIPMRLHECRDYAGGAGSFDTTLNGVVVRLNDDRRNNLEPDFPTSSVLTLRGEQMPIEVYAFKPGKAETYRKSEGVVFAVNGQTHGHLNKSFFSRKAVGMDRLKDSIFVVVDCSHMSGRNREDLFMNSRDRMEQGEYLSAIEGHLETILKSNQNLRDLRERRRREIVTSKLEDAKPFKEALEAMIHKSPSMAVLLSGVGRLSNPFGPEDKRSKHKFQGKQYPSFFQFRNAGGSREFRRTTAQNVQSSRIPFITDAANDYFTRSVSKGQFNLRWSVQCPQDAVMPDHNLNLHNGVATLNVALPRGVEVGDVFRYELVIDDDSRVEPFINCFMIEVGPPQKRPSGPKPPPTPPGVPQGLAMPEPVLVYKPQWHQFDFDENSALKVVADPVAGDDERPIYSYYVNMDNVHFQTELKVTKSDPKVVEVRWVHGLVLMAIGLLFERDSSRDGESDGHRSEHGNGVSFGDEVARVTRALAPVLLPLVEYLGDDPEWSAA